MKGCGSRDEERKKKKINCEFSRRRIIVEEVEEVEVYSSS